jgi:hypothetical protein
MLPPEWSELAAQFLHQTLREAAKQFAEQARDGFVLHPAHCKAAHGANDSRHLHQALGILLRHRQRARIQAPGNLALIAGK